MGRTKEMAGRQPGQKSSRKEIKISAFGHAWPQRKNWACTLSACDRKSRGLIQPIRPVAAERLIQWSHSSLRPSKESPPASRHTLLQIDEKIRVNAKFCRNFAADFLFEEEGRCLKAARVVLVIRLTAKKNCGVSRRPCSRKEKFGKIILGQLCRKKRNDSLRFRPKGRGPESLKLTLIHET
jgi:hypothetical protein